MKTYSHADFKRMEAEALRNSSANFNGQNGQNKKQKSKKMKTQKFGIKGENNTDKDVKLALLPGTFNTIEEIQKVYPEIDGIITDGESFSKTIGGNLKKVIFESKSQKTIEHLKTYAKRVVGEIKDMDIVSMDKENFQQDIVFVETSPFDERPGFTERRLARFVSTHQNDNNRAICKNINIPFHPASLVILTICANSRMDITMDIGAAN